MAKEKDVEATEEVKAPKGDSGKLLLLVALVMIVVSIAISAISLVSIMGLKSQMAMQAEEAAKPDDMGEIPVGEIDTFAFTENFIFIFTDKDDPSVTHNVVVDISVGIHNTEDDFADVLADLSSKEVILRDGLGALVLDWTFDDFTTNEGIEGVKADILTYIQGRLGSSSIVDVYFSNMLTSTR